MGVMVEEQEGAALSPGVLQLTGQGQGVGLAEPGGQKLPTGQITAWEDTLPTGQ